MTVTVNLAFDPLASRRNWVSCDRLLVGRRGQSNADCHGCNVGVTGRARRDRSPRCDSTSRSCLPWLRNRRRNSRRRVYCTYASGKKASFAELRVSDPILGKIPTPRSTRANWSSISNRTDRLIQRNIYMYFCRSGRRMFLLPHSTLYMPWSLNNKLTWHTQILRFLFNVEPIIFQRHASHESARFRKFALRHPTLVHLSQTKHKIDLSPVVIFCHLIGGFANLGSPVRGGICNAFDGEKLK